MGRNDVIMLSEHWLHSNCLNRLDEVSSEFNCLGISSNSAPAEDYGITRGQGGVAIFWRKDLKGVSALKTIEHDRICGIRIDRDDNSTLAFLSVYLPSKGSPDSLNVALDELAGVLDDLGDKVIPIIGGDFNGDIGNLCGSKSKRDPSKAGRLIAKFMANYNLLATNLLDRSTGNINTFECHNGTSTIDYIMIPEFLVNNIVKCHTGRGECDNTSDHFPIELELNVESLPRSLSEENKSPRLKWHKLTNTQLCDEYQNPIREACFHIGYGYL